jgi:hypothetical protein
MSADLEDQLRADLARFADGVGEPSELLRGITARAREQGRTTAHRSRRAKLKSRRRRPAALAGLAGVLVLAVPVITVLLVRAGRETPRIQPVTPPASTTMPSPATTVPTSAFSYYGYRFEFPTSWKRYPHQVDTTPGSNYGYLSTQPVQDPCEPPRRTSPTECGTPLNRLDPDGVLLGISQGSLPASHLTANAAVAGGPADLQTGPASGQCAEIGGARQTSVDIGVRDEAGDAVPWIQITACFAGPNPQIAEAQLTQALDTATREPG